MRKETNTSPGLSALTYEMLKMLPEEGLDDLFKSMNRLWLVKHVPEFWTLKGLVGLPKKDVVQSVNDLRPIELIEVTRKLCTAMVTRRLIGAESLRNGSRPTTAEGLQIKARTQR
jgi:hypothetical protein